MASRPATPRATSIFDLPEGIRSDIYQRVLVVRHPIYLFQEKRSRVETFAPDRPTQWLALLHVSQQVCNEARAVLYGMNRFVLVDETPQQVGLLRSFLDGIGSVSVDHLSHLSINFPVIEGTDGQPREVKIREDDLQSLRLLQANCTSLTTLETFVHRQNSKLLTEANKDISQLVREGLPRIDSQLRAIPSLKKIIVRVYVGTFHSAFRIVQSKPIAERNFPSLAVS
ncbi:hypothetical protein EDB81DRAFT_896492 [Dactylonectria macrodidyma]|uniref:Uncharacterized protein n=1 Tax=Dactylonectria macrodidyma TaxID=307937 RepID=A0A9P9FSE2_9HYPO|nr:hypothetical protein EDB81DRAFT_896492 [Dactylonectria macrodidyma]